MASTICTGFSLPTLLLNRIPLTAQCGYLAACKIIFVYARADTLYSVILSTNTANSKANKSNQTRVHTQNYFGINEWTAEKVFFFFSFIFGVTSLIQLKEVVRIEVTFNTILTFSPQWIRPWRWRWQMRIDSDSNLRLSICHCEQGLVWVKSVNKTMFSEQMIKSIPSF